MMEGADDKVFFGFLKEDRESYGDYNSSFQDFCQTQEHPRPAHALNPDAQLDHVIEFGADGPGPPAEVNRPQRFP
jgi:hypothetical protein